MSAFRIPLHWELQNHNLPACTCIMIQRGKKSTLKFFWNHVLHFSKVGSGIAIVIVKHSLGHFTAVCKWLLSLSLPSEPFLVVRAKQKQMTPKGLLHTTVRLPALHHLKLCHCSQKSCWSVTACWTWLFFFPWRSINTSLGCWVDLSLCLLLGIQSAFFVQCWKVSI